MDKFIKTNGIQLHFLDHPGGAPPVVLMHGLSANAHIFNGLIQAGLSPAFRVLAVDLRGRGQSGKPDRGYSMAEHAADIIGMLDHLQLEQVIMGGHSFGALAGVYLASHYPERVQKVLIMDAAARLHDNVREMVAPSTARLLNDYDSFEALLEKIKGAEYLAGYWSPEVESYYRADVYTGEDGRLRHRAQMQHIQMAINEALLGGVDWLRLFKNLPHPALLLQANDPFTLGAPVLPEAYARETVAMLPKGTFAQVPGNHMTMLFGEGAKATVEAITQFIKA